jgi:hypothetical protein
MCHIYPNSSPTFSSPHSPAHSSPSQHPYAALTFSHNQPAPLALVIPTSAPQILISTSTNNMSSCTTIVVPGTRDPCRHSVLSCTMGTPSLSLSWAQQFSLLKQGIVWILHRLYLQHQAASTTWDCHQSQSIRLSLLSPSLCCQISSLVQHLK